MASKIKNIAFDLMGVVITEGHFIKNGLMPLLPKDSNYEEVKEQYVRVITGKMSEQTFWENVYPNMPVNFVNSFLNSFQLDPEFKDVIDVLELDYEIGVLSGNLLNWSNFFLNKYGVTSRFNPMVISSEIGASKPSKEIYEAYIQRSKLTAQEIMFVDDSKHYLKPAHDLGMVTVWFEREEKVSDFTPDYTIRNLKDLLEITDKLSHSI
jgi:FMN phosphatase YigB (HAD superfamily)